MSKPNINDAVERFLNGGGEITRLRYASDKVVKKAGRKFYHRDKTIAGAGNSKAFLEREEKKESTLIFSKADRWSDDS